MFTFALVFIVAFVFLTNVLYTMFPTEPKYRTYDRWMAAALSLVIVTVSAVVISAILHS